MAKAPEPLVPGDEWLEVGSPFGIPGRERSPQHVLKDAQHAIRDLEIPLIAGEMEPDQDVVG
jgi:hypothetical protein